MSEALRLADALEDTPNWQKESFGSDWKSSTMKFDRTPFEAATELRRLHAENEAMKVALKEAEKLDADANALAASSSALADSVDQLRALNAELVEALRLLVSATEGVSTNDYNEEAHDIAVSKARAALAKTQGENNGQD